MVVEGPGNKAAGKYLQIYIFQNVVWKVQKSLCQLVKQNQVKVIMMHGLAWRLLYSAKGNLQKWVIVSGVVLAFWIFFSSRSICTTT
ncbi:uncharacterized protein [Procambarus clarkii]|uniref:uncharacterized protein isoform X5 n=1 Tax=Procambarus clarkii TaxID=6728 RepID=UPI00374426B8